MLFEVSGTPKDLRFLFRVLVRWFSSLWVSISTLDSKCWTESVAVSCPGSSLILLMEEVSCPSRYWYRTSSKVIMSSDAFFLLHVLKVGRRQPGCIDVCVESEAFWYHFVMQACAEKLTVV